MLSVRVGGRWLGLWLSTCSIGTLSIGRAVFRKPSNKCNQLLLVGVGKWQIRPEVKETVIFTFSGGPFTYVYRDLPTDKTDGVVVLSATMDEHTMPRGTGAGQVEIAAGNPVKVTWHFAPLSDQTHTFVLAYRDLGVVQKAPGADLLNWEVLRNLSVCGRWRSCRLAWPWRVV